MFLIENGKLVDYNRNCRKSVLMIPEGVKEIDSCGFLDDHWVTELILPESLEIIGACAFQSRFRRGQKWTVVHLLIVRLMRSTLATG